MCIINVLCSMIISVISSVYADDTPLSPTLTQEQLSAEERRLNRIVNRPSKVIIIIIAVLYIPYIYNDGRNLIRVC